MNSVGSETREIERNASNSAIREILEKYKIAAEKVSKTRQEVKGSLGG